MFAVVRRSVAEGVERNRTSDQFVIDASVMVVAQNQICRDAFSLRYNGQLDGKFQLPLVGPLELKAQRDGGACICIQSRPDDTPSRL